MAEYVVRQPAHKNDVRAVLGDAVSSAFIPRLRLSRWSDEARFQVEHDFAGMVGNRTFSQDGERYTLDNSRATINFYPEDSGYEFEIILKRRPATNVISLPISGANLAFFYQPPLTEEWSVGQDLGGRTVASVTETEVIDDLGEVNISRPENVVGSYAVYHSSRRGNFEGLGGHNYMAGKAFHVYRPRVTDVRGSSVWAALNVDPQAGRLTITIPQSFIDSARYPITVDPTIGYESEGGSERTASATYLWTSIREQSDATGGTASKLSAYLRLSSGTTATIKMGYYVDNAGTPEDQALVAADNVGVAFTSGTDDWIDSNAISGTVAASTYYWPTLMVSSTNGTLKYNYDAAGGNVAYYDATGSQTSLPDTFTHGLGSMTDQMSFYITYAAAAPSGMTNEVIVVFES